MKTLTNVLDDLLEDLSNNKTITIRTSKGSQIVIGNNSPLGKKELQKFIEAMKKHVK